MATATLTPLPCLHREVVPPRQCSVPGCRTWLASANPSDECAEHGGWVALATYLEHRDSLAELMEAA